MLATCVEVVVRFPEVTSDNLLLGGGDRHTEKGVFIVDVGDDKVAVIGLVVIDIKLGEDELGTEGAIVGRILRCSELEQQETGSRI